MVRKNVRRNINTCRSIVTLLFRIHYPWMKNMVNDKRYVSLEAVVEVLIWFSFIDWFYFYVRDDQQVQRVCSWKRRFLCMKRNCSCSYRQSATVDWILRLRVKRRTVSGFTCWAAVRVRLVLVASKSWNMHRHCHAGVVEERTVGVATNQYGVLQRTTYYVTKKCISIEISLKPRLSRDNL